MKVAGYGTWKSPIRSELIVAAAVGIGQIQLSGDEVFWIESRPAEGGRQVVVRGRGGVPPADVTPPPFSARSRANEYGGGAFAVSAGVVYFSNDADQCLYALKLGTAARPITPAAKARYADAVVDTTRRRLICVREDHGTPATEPVNALVAVGLDRCDEPQVLVGGSDFYSSPSLSPDGCRLAWLSWRHPNMPWDGTELWIGEMRGDGTVSGARRLAGGVRESIFQPAWSPAGELYFVSDRTGWWNLYRWRGDVIEPVVQMDAELGRAQWVFGMSTYGFAGAQRLICTYQSAGRWHLASVDAEAKRLQRLDVPYSELAQVRVGPQKAVFAGGSAAEPTSVVELDLESGRTTVLRRSFEAALDRDCLSAPEPIEFETEGGRRAYAFYYAPRNPAYGAPEGERPPLLVKSHGGPTAAASSALDLRTQYWTSRGIAVLDVNYGGSTGYGRAYRERLDGQWGIVDVDDVVNGVRALVKSGRVDAGRMAITGGSAGGYTTLCALTFRDVFRAGASYYGVSDLEALAQDTHKFESRYLDRLVGPYPECAARYRERSPIHHAERLSCPVVFFQGLEDRVVPPAQTEGMVAALRARGLPVAYVPFEGEQHGFRRADSIKRALDGELYFYSRVFGFALAEPVEPLAIENLP